MEKMKDEEDRLMMIEEDERGEERAQDLGIDAVRRQRGESVGQGRARGCSNRVLLHQLAASYHDLTGPHPNAVHFRHRPKHGFAERQALFNPLEPSHPKEIVAPKAGK